MKKHVFTLVELLVVIAIIGILASILLPALSKAKELAKSSTCISNLKQSGTAWMLYGNDFDGYMPANRPDDTFVYQPSGSTIYNAWDSYVSEWRDIWKTCPGLGYVQNTNIYSSVFRCPVTMKVNTYNVGRVYGSFTTSVSGTKYVHRRPDDWWQNRITGGGLQYWPKSPSNNYGLIDSVAVSGGATGDQFSIVDLAPATAMRTIHMRHNNTANAWMLDGSARNMNRSDLISWTKGAIGSGTQVFGGSHAGEKPDNLRFGEVN